ncbi:MAG: hypothetical protein H6721_12990 [Sandaracinus sp.]|nr:hypothetical protein [Sandaracinus sp.]MCB9619026.1 hypothetical protein [Sandaracinus sp.]MCB9633030.1 hypothetical protein [Sandaracinus sp.]
MAGFPIEEAFVAPALALVAALGVPYLTRKLAPHVLPKESEAAVRVGGAIGASVAVIALGAGSLGPALVSSPSWSWAYVAGLLLLVAADTSRRPRALRPGGAVLAAAGVGLAFALGGLAARRIASQPDGDAWWSIRLAPWNVAAYRAAAWELAAESPERATALLELAERVEPGGSETLRLRAELAAVGGDCEEARRLYRRAIEEHAREALEAWERLELGALPVPEQLTLRCGLRDGPLDW